MGRKRIDLTGKRFGKLTVISFNCMRGTRSYWNCVCDRGNEKAVGSDHLKNGDIVSCGCVQRSTLPPVNKKHEMSNTRLYTIWALMKYRCCNPSRKEYKRYGGRGIKVCDEWMEFKSFMEWSIANGYSDDLTLDRIDNDGDYAPSNCRWVSRQVQAFNKSTNRYITHNGQTKTITQWASDSNIPYYVLKKRIDVLHWDFERAISEPPRKTKKEK
jgi:hypothetical protein